MTTSQDEILQQLCNHLKTNAGFDGEIQADESLVEQLSLDSVRVLNLIMEIEDEFDITVPINVLADINTVRDLANIISRIKS